MYQEELMDHYHHPRHQGVLLSSDIDSGQHNPSCGDSVIIQAQVSDGMIITIAFQGKGCVISQATASMLTDYALGKSIERMESYSIDELLHLIKIPLGPTRLKCALLSLQAMQEGIKKYRKEKE